MLRIQDFRGATPSTTLSLIGRDYIHTASRLIDGALEEVLFTVFQSSFTPGKKTKPDMLIEAIVRAHQRKIIVKILINFYNTNTVTSKNRTLSQYLSERGVPVHAAGKGYLVHGKVLIIDRKTTIIGSHNLTQRGLWTNYEASVAIESAAIAENIATWFNYLWDRCKVVDDFG